MESISEAIERLELMADGDPQWDLSDNDRAAIRTVLDELLSLGCAQRNRRSERD